MPGGLSPEQVEREARRLVGRGLVPAGYFLLARVKEAVSVPAPRVRVISGPRSRTPGTPYYRATTPATPGAPPRKLSGWGRSNVNMDFDRADNVVRVGVSLPYMGSHERSGSHPFLRPTLLRYRQQIAAIIGGRVRVHG